MIIDTITDDPDDAYHLPGTLPRKDADAIVADLVVSMGQPNRSESANCQGCATVPVVAREYNSAPFRIERQDRTTLETLMGGQAALPFSESRVHHIELAELVTVPMRHVRAA